LRIARCAACGHGWVWPAPSAEALQAIYAKESYYRGSDESIGFSDYAALEPARRRMFERHLRRLSAFVEPGPILDVGCATGDFLVVARERGWQAYGIDPSSARTEAEARGVRLVGRTIQDLEPGTIKFAAVTFWDVLEHVVDPVGDLRRAAGLLAPGGVLALTVPDAGNLVARLSGRRWFGFKTAGEHLQFFTSKSLRLALKAAGMQVLVRKPTAWSCSVSFLGDRSRIYLGPLGGPVHALLTGRLLGGAIVDMPLINQIAMARPSGQPVQAVGLAN
jgi:2-polyprenyl-3-methyl-5-hydroxy-6-metoxy-1,4-benzoquinol methylase